MRHYYRILDRIVKEHPDFHRIRFHDLRHTHATLLLKAGIHPKIVQERLGHSSINVTLDTYSHVLPNLQEAV
ncbi:tyrosine-type recombinase/integrase [Paenibacillus sp. AK121]|nr:tyrosine-type recombinase/integrase [Paenibacillus sp. AK121]